MVILDKRYWNSMVSKAELLELINERGGKLMSNYINCETKVKIKCENDHIWEATPANLKAKYKKTWCPSCSTIQSKKQNNIKPIGVPIRTVRAKK